MANRHYEEQMLALSKQQSKKYWAKRMDEKKPLVTDDLVNRLRGRYPIGPGAEYGYRDMSNEVIVTKLPLPIMLEAAAEIERLRAKYEPQTP